MKMYFDRFVAFRSKYFFTLLIPEKQKFSFIEISFPLLPGISMLCWNLENFIEILHLYIEFNKKLCYVFRNQNKKISFISFLGPQNPNLAPFFDLRLLYHDKNLLKFFAYLCLIKNQMWKFCCKNIASAIYYQFLSVICFFVEIF